MKVMSNAFLSQAEFEQVGHWEAGPMELVFIDVDGLELRKHEWVGLIADWNSSYQGGYLRSEDTVEALKKLVPAVSHVTTPNLFIVPRINGLSELDVMLASLVPATILKRNGIAKKELANMWLLPFGRERLGTDFAQRACQAFEEYVWSLLVPASRYRKEFFSNDSPLRLLACDVRLWMSRIYRLALNFWEEFPITSNEDEDWEPLAEIETRLFEHHPELNRENVIVRRPRMGGVLWDHEDVGECQSVVESAISGAGVFDSLQSVLDVICQHGTHDDFSQHYSWVKEDFERSFYSKRAKVKVTLVESTDDFPVWEAAEPEGYANVLYRDVMAMLNMKERHLVVALRHGKTLGEISKQLGNASHSPVSRAVARLKAKVRRLLV